MKKWFIRGAAMVLIVACAIFYAGCRYILPPEEEPMAPPLVAPARANYKTTEVTRGDIQSTVRNQGTFTSALSQSVSVQYSGAIMDTVNVSIGDTVKQGDVLINLNSGSLEWDMQRAEMAFEKATIDYERNKNRGNANDRAITELNYQIAQSTYNEMKEKYERSRIVAPIDGEVTYITTAKMGEMVESFLPLVTIADPNSLELTFTEKNDYAKYKPGMDVVIEYKSESYTGKILSCPANNGLEPTHADRYKIIIEAEPALMQACVIGETARITTLLEQAKDVIVIPANLVRTYQNRNYVYVLVGEAQEERDVEIGIKTSTQVEIKSGLSEGDLLVVSSR